MFVGILHTEEHKELNTCEFKRQDITKLTCAVADSRIQFSWSVMSILVIMLCLCLALVTSIPSVPHSFHLCDHVNIKTNWCCKSEHMDTHVDQRREKLLL